MTTTPTNDNKQSKSSILSFVITAIILFAVVFLLRAYIIKPFIVNGLSMYPTFKSWDYLLIDQTTYNFIREPERGEVVVFHAPGEYNKSFYIKRVIGLPGETVHINGDVVSVELNDGSGKTITLTEPYVIDSKRKPAKVDVTLTDNEYYMLGDNRLESADSRYWGPLERDKIVGRPIVRLFPLNKVNMLPGDYNYSN
jgi:signal peptidase I